MSQEDKLCSQHPDAPHGFDRNASHNAGRYVCECEGWEPVAWEGAEEWMPLAYALCAEEHGEESCNDLIWEGGPIPEPWGERWLKYEYEAKRMIALVRENAVPKQVAAQEPVAKVLGALMTSGRSDKYAMESYKPLEVGALLYANAAPCARCKELEATIELLHIGSSPEAQAKITEQAAEIERLKKDAELHRKMLRF